MKLRLASWSFSFLYQSKPEQILELKIKHSRFFKINDHIWNKLWAFKWSLEANLPPSSGSSQRHTPLLSPLCSRGLGWKHLRSPSAISGASNCFLLILHPPCILVPLALNQDLQNLCEVHKDILKHLQGPVFKKLLPETLSPLHNKAQRAVVSIYFNMNLNLFRSLGSFTFSTLFCIKELKTLSHLKGILAPISKKEEPLLCIPHCLNNPFAGTPFPYIPENFSEGKLIV